MKQSKVRVILADDNQNIRTWIRKLLSRTTDIEVVGEASNGIEVISLIDQLAPDVLLLDVEMPLLNGLDVAQQLKNAEKEIPILVLSAYSDRQYIRAMLANGVAGYMVKEEAPSRLLDAVRAVARGETGWISPQIKAKFDFRG